MRYMLAYLLPGIALLSMRKYFSGVMCIILQCTILGWPIAVMWAQGVAKNYYDDRRNNVLAAAFERGSQPRIV